MTWEETIQWAVDELTKILSRKPETLQDWHSLVNDLGAIRTRLELLLLTKP